MHIPLPYDEDGLIAERINNGTFVHSDSMEKCVDQLKIERISNLVNCGKL